MPFSSGTGTGNEKKPPPDGMSRRAFKTFLSRMTCEESLASGANASLGRGCLCVAVLRSRARRTSL
eukprot:10073927-Lingulodinium_polyedra.AAC.1